MISIFNKFLSILTVSWTWPTNINLDILSHSSRHKACVYSEPCWPSHHAWNALNDTLGGSLHRARPPPYVCHVPFINETACDIVKQNGTSEFWRAEQPGGYFDAAWENGNSYCNIDNDPNTPCDQGLVPIYVAKVKNVEDVRKAVKFAHRHRIQTRVKGASHDFLGRSSGNGTFGISTIDIKGIKFEDHYKLHGAPHSSKGHSVVHVGAGEHWYFVYKAADAHGVVVVGAQSYSVGAVGWVLSGGHSSMSPQYGLGVDNVLEFEIVTPDGKVRIANEHKHKDLFWALRGGGPGFGVITKVTYKTHPAIREVLSISFNLTYTQESYRSFLKTWGGAQSAFAANHISGYMTFTPTGYLGDLMVHNSANIDAANATMEPFYKFAEEETAAGRPVQIQKAFTVLPSYFSLYPIPLDQVKELNFGAGTALVAGSRLAPLSLFQGDRVDDLIDIFVNNPIAMIFLIAGGKVSEVDPHSTAIHPSWRTATHHIIVGNLWTTSTTFGERDAIRRGVTEQTQQLGKLVPKSGAYLNEADVNEPEWYKIFWGSNYHRLLKIKQEVDPRGIFTCRHCVGDDIDY